MQNTPNVCEGYLVLSSLCFWRIEAENIQAADFNSLLYFNLMHFFFLLLNGTAHTPWMREQFTNSLSDSWKTERGRYWRQNSGRIEFRATGNSWANLIHDYHLSKTSVMQRIFISIHHVLKLFYFSSCFITVMIRNFNLYNFKWTNTLCVHFWIFPHPDEVLHVLRHNSKKI